MSALAEGPGPRPVTQKSIVELVLDRVRRSILDGSLAPGSPLSIAGLSTRLDVSHIPVREALRQLEGEGLIELRRGRSAVVAPVSPEDLEEVFRLRALLEAEVMARAVRLYDEHHLVAIERAFAELAPRPHDDAESLAARHSEFHRVLVEPALTPWHGRLLDLLWHAHTRYMHLSLADSLARGRVDLRRQHTALLNAATSRSSVAARRAVKNHLERAVAQIMPVLAVRDAD